MQYTEHLNLNLPEATDPYDIGNENENMEILDSAIYNHGIILGTTSATGHVKTINDLTKTSLSNGEALSARMGNALGQMMAPIVTGPNYPSGITKKGDQFVYNGRLCVVTANTVSTSTAINIGSSGNANYASPITSQISDLVPKVSLTSTTVEGTITNAVDNTTDIYGNNYFFGFISGLNVKSGNMSASLLYNGKYYVRLQTYNASKLSVIFPRITSASDGDRIASFSSIAINQSSNNAIPLTLLLIKEDASNIRLISDVWSSNTSGSITMNNAYFISLRSSGLFSSTLL